MKQGRNGNVGEFRHMTDYVIFFDLPHHDQLSQTLCKTHFGPITKTFQTVLPKTATAQQ